VQDQPPSILEARSDLPASLDKLIDRALAKQPSDRFQTASELYQALTAAAAEGKGSGAAAIVPPVADTVANRPVESPEDDLDEVTVVRPRDEGAPLVSHSELPPYIRQQSNEPTLAGFNPWKILAPAAIALVAVFGLVFLLTRGSSQTPTNQTQGPGQSGLTADPNSQPVQATGTPTGQSERGIQPSSTPTPSSRNENANASQALPASTVSGDFGVNDNQNDAGRGKGTESPTPKPSPSAQKAEQPPPPRPIPSVKPSPRPSATPEGGLP
jgi:serine/threonine-protein kinase